MPDWDREMAAGHREMDGWFCAVRIRDQSPTDRLREMTARVPEMGARRLAERGSRLTNWVVKSPASLSIECMNDDQENRRGRAGAVSASLAAHQADVTAIPALAAQQIELNDSMALIDQLSQVQSSATTGVKLDKDTITELMIRKALQVAGQIKAFASVTGNQTLLEKMSITASEFNKLRDDLRDERAQEILDAANANKTALLDYGTTPATISALQTRIGTYSLAVPSTRTAQTQVSSATDLLGQEFKRLDMIQKERLDGLMEQFSDTNAGFYNEYKSARILVDAKGGGKKAEPAKPTPP